MHWWKYRRRCRLAKFNDNDILRRITNDNELRKVDQQFYSDNMNTTDRHRHSNTANIFFTFIFIPPKSIVHRYGTRIVVVCEQSPLNSQPNLSIILITWKSVERIREAQVERPSGNTHWFWTRVWEILTSPMTLSGKRLTFLEKDDDFVRRKMNCHRTEHDNTHNGWKHGVWVRGRCARGSGSQSLIKVNILCVSFQLMGSRYQPRYVIYVDIIHNHNLS